MRGCARVLVAIIGVFWWFWLLGFAWGVGMAGLFALLAYAGGGNKES